MQFKKLGFYKEYVSLLCCILQWNFSGTWW